MPITKLVLPVAGIGKRLRPLTLTTPKNLIPLGGRPIIEYALEEAREIGLKEVIIVLGPEQQEAYETYLATARGRYPEFVFHIRVQEQPFGNGHAVLQAKELITPGESFLARFPDDVIIASSPTLGALAKRSTEHQAPVFLLESIPPANVSRYGVVKATPTGESDTFRIWDLIEKPKIEEAPSNMIIIGGYALTYQVLEDLEELAAHMPQAPDGLPITDAFLKGLRRGDHLYGWEFSGTRLDCGTLDGLARAEEFIAGLERDAANQVAG